MRAGVNGSSAWKPSASASAFATAAGVPAIGVLLQLARGEQERGAAGCDGARAERARAVGNLERVAVPDLDVADVDAELVRDDLCERRLVALAMRRRAGEADDAAVVL